MVHVASCAISNFEIGTPLDSTVLDDNVADFVVSRITSEKEQKRSIVRLSDRI
jgi:hypothetical protein